jgi:hypothetical protein
MDIKRIVVVVGIAAIAMLGWVTFKFYFLHDPDNFHWADAKTTAVTFMLNHCKEIKCDRARHRLA